MSKPNRKRITWEQVAKVTVKITLWIFFIVYVVIPGILYMYPSIFARVIFLNAFATSGNFSDFESYGRTTQNTRNFYLQVENENIRLGVWHLIPDHDIDSGSSINKEQHFERLLSSGSRPIILYFHGNSHNRAGWFMLNLYRILCQENFQIVAVDYRGYGDSEGRPTSESDVLQDALTVYKYVRKSAPNSKVFLWGHSIGSGVVSTLVAELSKIGDARWIKGIVLEAPFTTLREAGEGHPHGIVYHWTPYFEKIFLDSFAVNNFYFENTNNLIKAECPIMILHAMDDGVVPYDIGKKLADHLLNNKKQVTFQGFPGGHGYYHSRIYRAPELPEIIRKYVK